MLAATWIFLYHTSIGLANPRHPNDLRGANLMGMERAPRGDADGGFSVGLAAIAGRVATPVTSVHPHMWPTRSSTMLAIVVLGRLGSLKGSVIRCAGHRLRRGDPVFTLPEGAHLKGVAALGIMVAVLLARPEDCSASPSRKNVDGISCAAPGPR